MKDKGKTVSRLIHNLQSDPDIKAAIAAKEKQKTASEWGLCSLRIRVARLNKLLLLNTPAFIISSEIALVIQAATLYSPKFLGEALLKSTHESICESKGFCVECGVFIPGKKLEVRYCPACVKKFKDWEKTMDEQKPSK